MNSKFGAQSDETPSLRLVALGEFSLYLFVALYLPAELEREHLLKGRKEVTLGWVVSEFVGRIPPSAQGTLNVVR